jgi:alpha-L-rhamnosidase
MYSFDSAAFFTNYLDLIRVDQNADGTVPDVVPFQRYGGRPADPTWSAAYPQLVYCMWKYYGDAGVVADHYPNLKLYLDYVTGRVAQSGMSQFYASYGDWVPPPPAPKCHNSYLSATSYLLNLQQMAVMAQQALGNSSESEQWQQLWQTQSAAFNAAFYNASAGLYDNGVQTALVGGCALSLSLLHLFAGCSAALLRSGS